MAGENGPSLQRDDGRLCERLHVVHDRRLAEIADGHREWRADARLAWLTLERLDQRRFFAADIGARSDMDLDVEVKALRPGDAYAEMWTLRIDSSLAFSGSSR